MALSRGLGSSRPRPYFGRGFSEFSYARRAARAISTANAQCRRKHLLGLGKSSQALASLWHPVKRRTGRWEKGWPSVRFQHRMAAVRAVRVHENCKPLSLPFSARMRRVTSDHVQLRSALAVKLCPQSEQAHGRGCTLKLQRKKRQYLRSLSGPLCSRGSPSPGHRSAPHPPRFRVHVRANSNRDIDRPTSSCRQDCQEFNLTFKRNGIISHPRLVPRQGPTTQSNMKPSCHS